MTTLQTVRREIDFHIRVHKADADAHHEEPDEINETKESHVCFVALMTEEAFS